MQTLDLYIVERIRADHSPRIFKHEISKSLLIRIFDIHETLLEFGIVGKLGYCLKLIEILRPILADLLCNQFAKARITSEQPTTWRDAVCHVDQLVWIQVVEG